MKSKHISGDKVLVKVPSPMPHPFDKFSSEWITFIRSRDGSEVTLESWKLVSGLNGRHWGFTITENKSRSFVSNWIPNEWLIKHTDAGLYKSPFSDRWV